TKQFGGAAPGGAPEWGWWVYRGDPRRSDVADRLPETDGVRWSAETVHETATRAVVENAVRGQAARPQPVLSGHFPIALGDLVVSPDGGAVRAVAAATGKVRGQAPLELGLDRLFTAGETKADADAWVNNTMKYHPHAVLENTTVGCLSTDGRRVYVV